MQQTSLEPQQLIAMIDYPPLHSPEAFRSYYEKHKSGDSVEPVIVVPSEIVTEYFKKEHDRFDAYKEAFEKFLLDHPTSKYFMLGGKHRSAAATALGIKIPVLIVADDADVAEVHAMMERGLLTGVPSVGETFHDTLDELEKHYFEHKRFWTMDEKTEAMVKNNDIPRSLFEAKLK